MGVLERNGVSEFWRIVLFFVVCIPLRLSLAILSLMLIDTKIFSWVVGVFAMGAIVFYAIFKNWKQDWWSSEWQFFVAAVVATGCVIDITGNDHGLDLVAAVIFVDIVIGVTLLIFHYRILCPFQK